MHVLPLKLVFHFGLMNTCVYIEDLQKIAFLPLSEILNLSVINESFNPHPYQNLFNQLP
jgi:hypothetical protein